MTVDHLAAQFADTGGPLTARVYQLLVGRARREYGPAAMLVTTDRQGHTDGAWSADDQWVWTPLPRLHPDSDGLNRLSTLVWLYRKQEDRDPTRFFTPDRRFPLLCEVVLTDDPLPPMLHPLSG